MWFWRLCKIILCFFAQLFFNKMWICVFLFSFLRLKGCLNICCNVNRKNMKFCILRRWQKAEHLLTLLTCPPCDEQSTHPTWILPCLAPGMICSRSKLLPKITTSQPDAYAYKETDSRRWWEAGMTHNHTEKDCILRARLCLCVKEGHLTWPCPRASIVNQTCHHMTALECRRIRLDLLTISVVL